MIDDDRLRPGLALHDLDLVLDGQELRHARRIGDRGRQADEAHLRRQRRDAGQAKRQVMAALAGGEGMQLVDDHAAQAGEELHGIGIAQQQRQRFRRGHQEIGRPLALAQAAALRRVAGAAFGAHRQLPSRRSASRGCGGCRWPAPSGARCRACAARPCPSCGRGRLPASRRSVSSINDGRKPARVLPPPVGAISSALLPCRARSIRASWCGRGAHPRLSNQRENRSGRPISRR